MKTRSKMLSVVLCCLCAGVAGNVLGQEAKPGSAEQDAVMQKWIEFATPGAEHEVLKFREGKWTCRVEMWMTPGEDPSVTEGTAEVKWIMGGRYLLDNTTSTFNNMPFEGMAIVGYDKLLQKYVSIWIDNMGTGIMQSTGTYDKATKTFTYTGMVPDVATGKYKKGRSTERVVSEDEWVLEMYDTAPDGKEYVSMKGTYRRVK